LIWRATAAPTLVASQEAPTVGQAPAVPLSPQRSVSLLLSSRFSAVDGYTAAAAVSLAFKNIIYKHSLITTIQMTRSTTLVLLTVFALALCSSFAIDLEAVKHQDTALFYNIFKDWTAQHNKQYGVEEMAIRFYNWKSNYDYVQEHNTKGLSYTLEMNHFADLTTEEFSALHLGLNVNNNKNKKESSNNKNENKKDEDNKNDNKKDENNKKENQNDRHNYNHDDNRNENHKDNAPVIPESIDWRNLGAVTSVKNQGQCGGCWAFSACGALEGLHAIKQKKLMSFSEQQLLDCSDNYGNEGCEGGLMTAGFQYTESFGVEPDVDYPFTGTDGTCTANSQRVAFRNKGYEEVTANDASALKAAVAQQPVSVGIAASSLTVQLFQGGVITNGCGTDLDHGVLAVGYDTTSYGQNYWIIKNSWGASWGLNGYFNIAMGSENNGEGVCGINMMASYPTF